MKTKLLATGIVATLLITILPSTYAFGGFGKGETKGFNFENREAIEEAISNQNYDAFVEASGNENITETQFQEMVERREDREAHRAEMEANHEAIQNAIENEDYATWKSLVNENNPMFEVINEGNFSKLQEIHTYQNKIQNLRGELGIEGKGFGGGEGMGFGGKGGKHPCFQESEE